jgi:peptidoglycan/xylan/chitin deacetylase (PgdA/CDA1 family)
MERRLERVVQRLVRRPIVLAYHRVADVARDPFLLAVRPVHFAEQLEVLTRMARPRHLADLVAAIVGGDRARAAVALTFDDGYVDNLKTALPLLETAEVPATMFVTSGPTGGTYWWDELGRLVLAPDTLPESLELVLGGQTHRWSLGGASRGESNGSWNVRSASDSPREALFRGLADLVRELPAPERDEVLAAVREWSIAAPPRSSADRCLSANEIAELEVSELTEIGAHTVTHPVLSLLTVDGQRSEIEGSRGFVENIVGRSPKSFAYPFGGTADFDEHTVDLVRRCGFDHAVTTRPGILRTGADPYSLPRFLVRDWDGDGFERRLRGLLYG